MKKNYLNVELCKACGGKCCKHMPGIAYPVDFKKPLLQSLIRAFKSGMWAIDWYEGDPTRDDKLTQVYYIRPRIKGIKELFDPSWGGECVFLTTKGCTLKPLERPKTCRMLEPASLTKCVFHAAGTKRVCAIAWLPYQDIILKAAEAVKENVEDAAIHPPLNAVEALLHV